MYVVSKRYGLNISSQTLGLLSLLPAAHMFLNARPVQNPKNRGLGGKENNCCGGVFSPYGEKKSLNWFGDMLHVARPLLS